MVVENRVVDRNLQTAIGVISMGWLVNGRCCCTCVCFCGRACMCARLYASAHVWVDGAFHCMVDVGGDVEVKLCSCIRVYVQVIAENNL